MNLFRLALFLYCFLLAGIVQSETITSPFQQANWQADGSKTICNLQQEVDNFGRIGFRQHSGEPLEFFLQPFDQSSEINKASLFVESAPWHDQLSYRQDFPVFLEGNQLARTQRLTVFGDSAENMLNALLQGRFPVFSFVRQHNKETRVAASSINFSDAYPKFIDCRQTLLPFNRRQLEQGSLFFLPRSATLSGQIISRLQQIADYLKELPEVNVVVVNATAKLTKGTDKRFEARAKQVVNRLLGMGIASKRVKTFPGANYPSGQSDIILSVFGPDVLRVFYYRKGDTTLNTDKQQKLGWLARYVNEFFQTGRVVINSHTDSKGGRAKNLATSQQRGDAIKAYLEAQGVAAERIQVKAHGERRPAKSNRYPSGRAMNRRVVIDLVQ